MSTTPPTTPPGWYPDQAAPGYVRYWDGQQWTEQRQPAQGAAPTMPTMMAGSPAKSGLGKGCLIAVLAGVVLLVLVGIGIVVAANSVEDRASDLVTQITAQSGNTENPPTADVTLTGCTVDDSGFGHATGTIVNHSSKTSDYTIHVNFMQGDTTRVAEGAGFETKVQPGVTTNFDVIGDKTDVPRSGVTCVISDVNRTESL